ncbi:MAG: hypothetical protein JST68_14045 [Bacteroidetes bacterium]|nr:hypothetical protein [Bacteroidota bacterium]
MRKHALIRNTVLLLLCITGLGLGSCKKEITQVVDQGFSATYSVKSSDWKGDGSGKYYHADFNVPELDDIIQKNGGVNVYISFDNGVTFEAVPEVVGNVAYGAYHQTGLVGVDLSPADNTGTVTPPSGTLLVKIVLLDATPLD